MSAHLDLDGLADLLAGEGADRDVQHVSTCARCSSALVELEDAQAPVREALAALPPPAVPADLHARLDAALMAARERDPAMLPAAGPETAVEPSEGPRRAPGTVVPLRRPAPRSPWLLRSAAAAVGLLVLGSAVALGSRLTGSDSGDSTATSGSGGAAPAAELAASVPTSSSGTDYGAGRDVLAAALPALLAQTATATDSARAVVGGPLARLHDPAQLADCLSGLADPAADRRPLALDYASYAAAPALVAVLPTAEPGRVDVFVVGAGCRAGAEQTLLYTRLDRPS